MEDQCIVGVQGAVRNKGPRETRYGRNSRYYTVWVTCSMHQALSHVYTVSTGRRETLH